MREIFGVCADCKHYEDDFYGGGVCLYFVNALLSAFIPQKSPCGFCDNFEEVAK